jgi:hypothetical protein
MGVMTTGGFGVGVMGVAAFLQEEETKRNMSKKIFFICNYG